jgi:hypothetical protein
MTDTETKPFGGYGFAIRTFWISGTDLVVSRRWEREWLIEPNAVARFSTSITGKAISEKDRVCVIGKDREPKFTAEPDRQEQSSFATHSSRKRTISEPSLYVRFVPILLQKSPRREARCALAPNTSLDLEGDYADDRQRDQRDLTLTSHMGRTAEVATLRPRGVKRIRTCLRPPGSRCRTTYPIASIRFSSGVSVLESRNNLSLIPPTV